MTIGEGRLGGLDDTDRPLRAEDVVVAQGSGEPGRFEERLGGGLLAEAMI